MTPIVQYSSIELAVSCIRLIFSVGTTDGYEIIFMLCYGEQLDKLGFSASHFIIYLKMLNYVHTQCLCIF